MSSLELPSELWLKVFCDLPFESLLNIHVVSWLFSDLSTSFIFEDVHFYPRESSIARTKRAIQREFHRATFWSSDKVAPHVRKCTVELTWISSGSMVAEFAPQLLSAYFEAVSRFKNLEKLCCSLHNPTNIDLPPLRVEKSLSRLRVLDIRGVRLAPQTSPAIRLKLEDLSYADIHSSQSIESDFLLSFDPTYLRRLCLELQSMSFLHDLLPDKHAMASFRHLHVLELRLQVTNIVDLHACISSFPGIHDLTLQAWRIDAGFVPSTPLAPELRTYKGPMDLIPALDLGSSVLRTLTLTDGDSRVLLRKLREIRLGNSVVTAITSLTMLVRQWYIPETDSNLRDTLSFFPALQTLSLTMYSHHFIDQRPIHATFPQELCERLAAILPVVIPLLETLELRWEMDRNAWGRTIPSLEQLKATLFPVMSHLKHILSEFEGRGHEGHED